MFKPITYISLCCLFFCSCKNEKLEHLASFEVFCEMVANEAKPIAFSAPMEKARLASYWDDYAQIAQKYEVQLFQEDSLGSTLLFPKDIATRKSFAIIYKMEERLTQYLQWKRDRKNVDEEDSQDMELISRRLGRLLGYSNAGINQLLESNSDYRNLVSFGVDSQISHLYYENLDEALSFYKNILGLNVFDQTRFQIGEDSFIELHPLDKNQKNEENKSTAVALLTDQLPEWYEHIKVSKVPVKYTYKPKEGGAHDGFVAIDPGGYLLEFEQFKQHPENELFMAVLSKAPKIDTEVKGLNFYGSITWTYHKDVLKMQNFYNEVLGFQMVADQGWTKIFQTSDSGFIGLVDEQRGMQDYSDVKGVEIEWRVKDLDGLTAYAKKHWLKYDSENTSLVGPERYTYRF